MIAVGERPGARLERARASCALSLGLSLAVGCHARTDAVDTASRTRSGEAAVATLGAPSIARVPTGPETCFDAQDNNGNGLIDEGCGIRTGIVQFAIAWDESTADVDLLVTDPKGELVDVGRVSSAGLVKERDCPGKHLECHGQNFENVYLDGDEPKRGRYRVRIRLEPPLTEDGPVRVTFGARVGPRSYSAEIELTRPEEEREMTFVL